MTLHFWALMAQKWRSVNPENTYHPATCNWFLTIGAKVQAINAQEGVLLGDLFGSDLCHGLDGVQPTVLSQCHWDYLQSVSKCPHSILLQ